MRRSGYIDQKEFIKEFRKCKRENRVSDDLAEQFKLIMLHNLNRKKWATALTAESKDQIISEGYFRLMTYWKCYKPKSGQPLPYFSRMFEMVILKYLNDHKRLYKKLTSMETADIIKVIDILN